MTTKVKGKGYVAAKNQSQNMTQLNRLDPDYYKKLFKLQNNSKYIIYDTTGKSVLFKI